MLEAMRQLIQAETCIIVHISGINYLKSKIYLEGQND